MVDLKVVGGKREFGTVEKLDSWAIRHEDRGFTTHLNKVLQGLCDAEALGVWCYLSSLPPNWCVKRDQLRSHFKFGRDKIASILLILSRANLIEIIRPRDNNGSFLPATIIIKSGADASLVDQKLPENVVQISADELHSCTQSCTELHMTDSIKNKELKTTAGFTVDGLPVTGKQQYIKYIYTKEIKNKKDIYCASGDARNTFEEFWSIYPVKKNKQRSQKLWESMKLDVYAKYIIQDVKDRLAGDSQWRDERYIPHPSTYLNNRRWEDDIKIRSGKDVNAFSDFMDEVKNGR